MKFLILLFYYERPKMLTNALLSVKNSTYQNWELCIIDDGIRFPATTVIEKCFTPEERESHRISYIQTMDSEASKKIRGGSQFGMYANLAIKASDADIVIMLCDDDLLKPDYMEKLNQFYLENPSIKYSYSHLEFYNPYNGLPQDGNVVNNSYTDYLVSHTESINPSGNLDSSQVTWKRESWINDDIQFPSPRTSNLDEVIYEQMYVTWGSCVYNKINGQWKGIHPDQLINLSIKGK